MKFSQKKHTNKLGHCFNIFWALCFLGPKILFAQDNLVWEEIELVDTLSYTSFGIHRLDNERYPPSQLFDGNFKTCWVSKLKNESSPPSLFVKMPSKATTVNLFAGYGKSLNLFYQNSIPKTIRLSIWGAINPDGFVSEIGVLYKAAKYPKDTLVHVIDTFDIQSISLSTLTTSIERFKGQLVTAYDSSFRMPKAEFCYILQLDILEEWQGTKYDDICISELFFDDRLVDPKTNISVDSIYINQKGNTLMANLGNDSKIIYADLNAELQLAEFSQNKNWAIVLAMPSKAESRVETNYLLINLSNSEIVNHKLDAYSSDYISGMPIYFEEAKNKLSLVYETNEGDLRKIELID